MSTNQEKNREALIDHIAELDKIIRRRNEEIKELRSKINQTPASIVIPKSDLPEVIPVVRHGTVDVDGYFMAVDTITADDHRRTALRYLALAEYLDAKPRPLAVGDRVWVVKAEISDGTRVHNLAVGDVGEVSKVADEDGDIRFRRDGVEAVQYVAAANVERIEDER